MKERKALPRRHDYHMSERKYYTQFPLNRHKLVRKERGVLKCPTDYLPVSHSYLVAVALSLKSITSLCAYFRNV